MSKNKPLLPGMPPENKYEGTPLGDAMETYASKKEKLARIKLDMSEIEKTLIIEMKKKDVIEIKATVDGENFRFSRVGSEHIRCAKITKQPRPKKEKDPVARAL